MPFFSFFNNKSNKIHVSVDNAPPKAPNLAASQRNKLYQEREQKAALFEQALQVYEKQKTSSLQLKGSRNKKVFIRIQDDKIEQQVLNLFIRNQFSSLEQFYDSLSPKDFKQMKKDGAIVFMPLIEHLLNQTINDFSLKTCLRQNIPIEHPLTWNKQTKNYQLFPYSLLLLEIRQILLQDAYQQFYKAIEKNIDLKELLELDHSSFALLISPSYVDNLTARYAQNQDISSLLLLPKAPSAYANDEQGSLASTDTSVSSRTLSSPSSP